MMCANRAFLRTPAFSAATRKIARGRVRDARPPGANPTGSWKGVFVKHLLNIGTGTQAWQQ